jgi:aconitate hydratase
VDHNLVQADHRNADDHVFLRSACRRFGIVFSRPGNGISHALHMERFGVPGKTLLGSDSHTCAAGALGMLAIGTGGLDVAMAIAGEPYRVRMPEVWGVELLGRLPAWVSAKDLILEMLRRHHVDGGVGRVIEYHGPGVATLDAMDRHVVCNMGAELGATTSVFPADAAVASFLRRCERASAHAPIAADPGCDYDYHTTIDLTALEPLVATPTSPGNVVPVRELAGAEIHQAYLGSSANPGYRDFAVAAHMVRGRQVHPAVSFDVNPTSRDLLEQLARDGLLAALLHAGARLHQAGCNGCIGMGQAPATGGRSLRTVPRNFPGRSGTLDDRVYLCSPETATASALTGRITDPRDLGVPVPQITLPERFVTNLAMFESGPSGEARRAVRIEKGPNIVSLPTLAPLPHALTLPVLLALDDDVSTDEILPAGARVLPYRSNVPRLSDFVFADVDRDYPVRARAHGDHAIVAGANYGQGSSREHAALAARFLGLRVVVAVSFARIHWQNLVNVGVLPLEFAQPADRERLRSGSSLRIEDCAAQLRAGRAVTIALDAGEIVVRHTLSARQRAILGAGGLIALVGQPQHARV